MNKRCPYCDHILPHEIASRTASRQQCPECKLWFIVDEWDDIYAVRDNDFMCKKCGENKDTCECAMNEATKCDLCGGIVGVECLGECKLDAELLHARRHDEPTT
ncbi:MAG: hypothetical protein ACXABY_30925 [Candidatus Thorarchaeota archaeon]|jgi:hypothetical protein